MKAVAFLTPLLVLGLLPLLHALEVRMRRTPRPSRARRSRTTRPTTKDPMMTELPAPEDGAELGMPVLRDPPPPPGYVEPLAGSTAEDTLGAVPSVERDVAGHSTR